jgi:hypothetical protein
MKGMMYLFIIFSFGHRTVKSFGSLSNQLCDHCHNTINKDILKVTTWFTLFFIPIIPYRIEYMIVCQICRSALKISKVDFEQIIEGESEHLQSGSVIGRSNSPQHRSTFENKEEDKYAGKTETQIAYLKQMEDYKQQQESHQ